MPEEFGTVNVKRDDRAKEIEAMRARFKRHRDTLSGLAADAPTLALGMEYNRLIKELDNSVLKLDALEEPKPLTDTQPVKRTEPGRKPLSQLPVIEAPPVEEPARSSSRIFLIVLIGLVVLGAVAWLMWEASSETPVTTTVPVTETETATIEPITPAPQPPTYTGPALTLEPPSHDYGPVRRGARATRQFEITNHSDKPMTIDVARSNCRCLYYAHNSTIAPNTKETITVTIDPSKVRGNRIAETIKVVDRNNAGHETSFNVTATIQ